jgi:hypothetical protein
MSILDSDQCLNSGLHKLTEGMLNRRGAMDAEKKAEQKSLCSSRLCDLRSVSISIATLLVGCVHSALS